MNKLYALTAVLLLALSFCACTIVGPHKADPALTIKNESAYDIIDVMWKTNSFGTIASGDSKTTNVQAESGYIRFTTKLSPISARTEELVTVADEQTGEFTFTDVGTTIVKESNPSVSGTLGAVQTTAEWWAGAENEAGVSALAANVWAGGSIAAASGAQWFSFTATAGTQYIYVTFGTLADMYVQVYNSTGAAVEGEARFSGGTASLSRALIIGQRYFIRVLPASGSGAYTITFSASVLSPPASITPLIVNTWTDERTSTAGRVLGYSFSVTSGTTYYLWWNDYKQGDNKSLDIKVDAEYSSSGIAIFTGEDSAWTSPKVFTAVASGTVILRVTPYTAGQTGTYAIAYSTHANVVTLHANGGAFGDGGETAAMTVSLRQAAGTLPVPVRTGYTLAGWNTAANGSGTAFTTSTLVSANIAVYAQWAENYTVTFNENGGSGVDPITKTAVYPTYNVDALPTPPTRTGYTFTGWSMSVSGAVNFTASTTVSANITVYAQWNLNQYTVTFNNNGGSGVNPTTKTVVYPAQTIDALPLTEPVRTGYTFTGWNTSANGSGTAFTADYSFDTAASGGSLTAYAQWVAITYTIVYDKNTDDATGTMEDSEHTYDAAKTLTANGYTRTGYTFAGWNTEANGSGTNYAAGVSVLNLRTIQDAVCTLYARWTVNVYTVTFNNNGGSGVNPTTKTVTYPATTIDALPTPPTRSGYTFTGWNTATNGSGTAFTVAYTFNTAASGGTRTVYALWIQTNITSTLGTSVSGSSITLAMRWIPAGTFTMGSPTTEAKRDAGETQHTVTLTKGFYIGIYPVTQEQYEAVMTGNLNGLSATPSAFKSSPVSGEEQAKRPVEQVRWYQTLVFCNRLSIKQGLTPVYSIAGLTDPSGWGNAPTSNNATWNAVTANWNANGYRLPTDAEWEYACRAGTTTMYYTGIAAGAALQAAAWYTATPNVSSRTHQVGLKTPNAWGLYDMHGNVWEWCWDWYADFSAAAATDPVGPASGTYRMFRGGAWISDVEDVRSAKRGTRTAWDYANRLGLRLVRYP